MKRPATSVGLSTPAPEYRRSDFGKPVRRKYVARLQASSNVVILDPEVAELFPNAAAVNAALRSLGETAKRADSLRSRSGSSTCAPANDLAFPRPRLGRLGVTGPSDVTGNFTGLMLLSPPQADLFSRA